MTKRGRVSNPWREYEKQSRTRMWKFDPQPITTDIPQAVTNLAKGKLPKKPLTKKQKILLGGALVGAAGLGYYGYTKLFKSVSTTTPATSSNDFGANSIPEGSNPTLYPYDLGGGGGAPSGGGGGTTGGGGVGPSSGGGTTGSGGTGTVGTQTSSGAPGTTTPTTTATTTTTAAKSVSALTPSQQLQNYVTQSLSNQQYQLTQTAIQAKTVQQNQGQVLQNPVYGYQQIFSPTPAAYATQLPGSYNYQVPTAAAIAATPVYTPPPPLTYVPAGSTPPSPSHTQIEYMT
jgi:hypothetical protein